MTRKNHMALLGLAVFLTAGTILLFYDTMFGGRVLLSVFQRFLSALRPILYGAFIAYLIVPVVGYFEEFFFSRQIENAALKGRISRRARAVSLIATWLVVGLLCYLLLSVLVPELARSVVQLISNVETYYNTIEGWIRQLLETYPSLGEWAAPRIAVYMNQLENWVDTSLLPQATMLLGIVTGGVMGVLGFLGDLLVAAIVSVYLLATKERCAAQCRKILCGLFPRTAVYWILRATRKADRIFSGFVRGKLLDSLIIGILCFIGCSILKIPYALLISVVVGVTNVIPFFGPFLGAIPSVILILLVSPIHAVYFSLFVLLLQQLDGNIIGPKILGSSTGLSSLWVIIVILVAGSFFGLAGMFFGVPVFACIYSGFNFLVDRRLREKDLPTDPAAYTAESQVIPREEPED